MIMLTRGKVSELPGDLQIFYQIVHDVNTNKGIEFVR